MAKCNTADGRLWDSEINRQHEGQFSIEREDSNGDFDGEFRPNTGRRQRIRGNCSANGIVFLVPAVRPQFIYHGKFDGDDELRGKRVRHSIALGVAAEDEWVAQRPTTLATKKKSTQSTSSE